MNLASTAIATLVLGVIAGYTEWEPTAELRLARPKYTTSKADILQQQWRRYTLDTMGAISGSETEWRDVPIVIK